MTIAETIVLILGIGVNAILAALGIVAYITDEDRKKRRDYFSQHDKTIN